MSKRPAATVHMHLLSHGVVDVMCKGKKPASMSGMQYACQPKFTRTFLNPKWSCIMSNQLNLDDLPWLWASVCRKFSFANCDSTFPHKTFGRGWGLQSFSDLSSFHHLRMAGLVTTSFLEPVFTLNNFSQADTGCQADCIPALHDGHFRTSA